MWTVSALAVLTLAAAVPRAPREEAGRTLREEGVVLVEGVALEDFESVARETWQAAGFPQLPVADYNGLGSVTRPLLSAKSYDVAAGAPPELPVAPHSEQAYLFEVPRFAAFLCLQAAEKGGELQLFDNVEMARQLGSLVDKLETLGVTYQRVLGDKVKSPSWSYPTGMWQDRFATEDWPTAQRRAREQRAYGGQRGAELRDFQDGLAVMNWTVPAVTLVNVSDGVARAVLQSILDNHASMSYGQALAALHSTWGDGSAFGDEELRALRAATTPTSAVEVLMQPHQVVVIDNWRFAHGRRPYEGPRNHAALISERFQRVARKISVEL